MEKIKNYLELMRIKHYIKNFLIFFPLVFSKRLCEVSSLLRCILAFVILSLVCSIVYIVNDINDVEKDKLHPKKKNRPIASGKVSIKEAICLVIFLLILVVAGLVYLNASIYTMVLLALYLVLNLGYSFGLKNIPLLDIAILVSGFLIRVVYGASVIGVEVSDWLYLTIITMSFYLVLGKRRNEIIKTDKNTRKVLKYYNKEFLDKNMYMCLAMAIVFYSLWTVGIVESSHLTLTVPFVIIICMRYSMLVEQDSFGDPVDVVLSDKVLLCSILAYGLLVLGLLYLI